MKENGCEGCKQRRETGGNNSLILRYLKKWCLADSHWCWLLLHFSHSAKMWTEVTLHNTALFFFTRGVRCKHCCLWPLWHFSVTISKYGMRLLHESVIPRSCHSLNMSHRDEHRNRVLGLQWRAAQHCITSGLFGHFSNNKHHHNFLPPWPEQSAWIWGF